MRTQKEGIVCKPGRFLTRNKNGWHLDFGCPSLQSREINVSGVSLLQPEQTKALIDTVVRLSLSGHRGGWRKAESESGGVN